MGVVIVAGGNSRRMGNVDKVFAPLLGRPLIAHTVSVFEECPFIHEIVLVLGSHNLEQGRTLVVMEGWRKVKNICVGGVERYHSVKAGLQHLSPCDWIMVHDGARPCVTPEIIESGLESALETGAAVPIIGVSDTVKRVEGGLVVDTLNRDALRAVQTPQVFRSDVLQKAYKGKVDGVTDDASLVERLGHRVNTFPGSEENIKVTTQVDLRLAEVILKSRVKV